MNNTSNTGHARMDRLLAWGAGALTILAAAGLLYAAWCAFTAFKFTLIDYGGYTNMIWNTGHGQPFRMMMEYRYLRFHLSFTLALLGPLFRIWDHPFLLSFLQWAMLLGGTAALVFSIGGRNLSAPLRWAWAFFFVANPFTQSVVLSEFHGVALYFVLFPWLYLALSRRDPIAWIPLGLIAGLREDAAFVVLPMALYFAIRHRWPAAWFMTGAALAYGVFACTGLFTLINGFPLTAQRSGLKTDALLRQWMQTPWRLRLVPLFWLALPILPFLRRGWIPLLAFPSVSLLINLLSPQKPQFTFSVHYSAPVVVLLALAIWHTLTDLRRDRLSTGTGLAVWLIAIVLIAHVTRGFLPGGGQRAAPYARPDPKGCETLSIVRALPRDGILLCNWKLAGFCANRADLMTWKYPDPSGYKPDIILFVLDELTGEEKRAMPDLLKGTEYGVFHKDSRHLILQRGAHPAGNRTALEKQAL